MIDCDPVVYRTGGRRGFYMYHDTKPEGLVSEALYSEEYVNWLKSLLRDKVDQLDEIQCVLSANPS